MSIGGLINCHTRHFNDIQNTIHNDATITVAMRCKLANYSSRAG